MLAGEMMIGILFSFSLDFCGACSLIFSVLVVRASCVSDVA